MNEELTVLVADDEPELLQAVCQLIDWQALGWTARLRSRRKSTHSTPRPASGLRSGCFT